MTEPGDLQRKMAGFFRRGRDLAKDEEARAFAELHIGSNDRLSAVEQLEIYREQFWFRHTDSLVEDFPGVGGILGQAAWQRLVEEYLAAHPPASFTLRDLGDHLADFILRRDWLEERDLAGDMARLEWAHVEVFDADDAPRLDPEKLGAVPEEAWENARLVADPGLRVLHFEYRVVALREALLKAHDGEGSVPLPRREPCDVAVHRRLHLIHHDPLSPDAFALLSRLVGGAPLGEACRDAAAALGVALEALAENLEGWFADWARRGYLVDVVVSAFPAPRS